MAKNSVVAEVTFNILSYRILKFRLNSLKKIHTYDFEKHNGEVVLLKKPQFVPEKFICFGERDETFKNRKRYEDKDFYLLI